MRGKKNITEPHCLGDAIRTEGMNMEFDDIDSDPLKARIDHSSFIFSRLKPVRNYFIGKCYQYGVILLDPEINEDPLGYSSRVYSSSKKDIVNLDRLLEMASFNVSDSEIQRIVQEYEKWFMGLDEKHELRLLRLAYQKKRSAEKIINNVLPLLKNSIFSESDNKIMNFDSTTIELYEKTKSNYIKNYAVSKWKIPLNSEQSLALSRISKNQMVSARAGSGKTSVLSAKPLCL